MMLRPEIRDLFPLSKMGDLERLLEMECFNGQKQPDLTLMSIVLGAVEHSLVSYGYDLVSKGTVAGRSSPLGSGSEESTRRTPLEEMLGKKVQMPRVPKRKSKNRMRPSVNKNKVAIEYRNQRKEQRDSDDETETKSFSGGTEQENQSEPMNNNISKQKSKFIEGADFPEISLEYVEELYSKFWDMLEKSINFDLWDAKEQVSTNISKDVVTKVLDVVWSYLSRSYKADTPHIQTLHAYLIDKKLDSFGVAAAVVAACQKLDLDVYLCISEDHAWVAYNLNENGVPKNYLEVTWHGSEDKRGKEIEKKDMDDSWLYLNGFSVVCNRHMEVAAIIAAMNPFISQTTISKEIIEIQRQLLQKLYVGGFLEKYPMGLVFLSELEDLCLSETADRMICTRLLEDAIASSRRYYDDMHVLPYTCYGNYYFSQKDFKNAIKLWAYGAEIVKKYKHSKGDEEIYREFLEVSTDLLPNIMKQSCAGFSANSIIRDPGSFAHLLRFFDNICLWEEHSNLPIVHITWTKAWVSAIGKFDYTIRRMVHIIDGSGSEEGKENSKHNYAAVDVNRNSKIFSSNNDGRTPKVIICSDKLLQLKDFFKLEKYNPSAMTLALTAQSTIASSEVECGVSNGSPGRCLRRTASSDRKSDLESNTPHKKFRVHKVSLVDGGAS